MKKDSKVKRWINNTKPIKNLKSLFSTIHEANDCVKAMDIYPDEYKEYKRIVKDLIRAEKELNSPYNTTEYNNGLQLGIDNLEKQKAEMEKKYKFCYIPKEKANQCKKTFERFIAALVAAGLAIGAAGYGFSKSKDEGASVPKEPEYSDGDIDLGNDDTSIFTEDGNDILDNLGITKEEFENYLSESDTLHTNVYNFLILYKTPNRTEAEQQRLEELAEKINFECDNSRLHQKILSELADPLRNELGIDGVTDVNIQINEEGSTIYVITDRNGEKHRVSVVPNQDLVEAADSSKAFLNSIGRAGANIRRLTIYEANTNPNYKTTKYDEAFKNSEMNLDDPDAFNVALSIAEVHALDELAMSNDEKVPGLD